MVIFHLFYFSYTPDQSQHNLAAVFGIGICSFFKGQTMRKLEK